ncbi:hypothetical protein ACF1B0_35930 [Streptomyces anandii]|uniref:hypothetical protein n=1 Tax=Streptomyces anandii TaxID=285454 RepID=UPI0036FEE18C
MGTAPQTMQKADLTEEQVRDAEREWFLDGDTGELKPEHTERRPQDRPGAIRVARWTFD